MPQIDYAAVRAQVSLRQVLDLIGYPGLLKFAGQTYGHCPFMCENRRRGCSFQLDKNLWHCHRCGEGGNQLDLYAKRRGMTLFQATMCLCRQMGIATPWLEAPKLPSRSNDPTGERRAP